MAVELATAYISLAVSSKDLASDVKKSLGAVDTQKQGGQLGDGLLSGIGKALKVGAVAVGATAIAGIGTALVKGFQRLDSLDQATAKLTGLGHSAETVQQIMDNALASVKGTAYGMGDAASVAAQMVAAGVKPGKDLERTLRLVGDAATIAGVDMGSLGSIFGKVAASNKVQMDVINQLHDAGVPALAMLATQMGVTAEEASKMASDGKIDFATFQAAMETGLGGAALESGNTFSGAMDNMMAALGRVGAKALGGVFPIFKDGFGEITAWLDGVTAAIEPFATAAGEMVSQFVSGLTMSAGVRDEFAGDMDGLVLVGANIRATFESVGSVLGAFFGWIGENLELVKGLAVAVGILAGAILVYRGYVALVALPMQIATAAQIAWNAAMMLNPIGIIIAAIVALVAGLVWFFTQTELGQEVWANFTNALGVAVTWLWESIIKPVVDFIGAAWDWLYNNVILPVMLGIMLYIGLWAALFEWLWGAVLKPVFDAIGAIFTWIWSTIIQPIIGYIQAAIQMWGAIFDWLYNAAVKPALDAIGKAFKWVYETIIRPVAEFISGAIQKVGDTVRSIFGGIASFIGSAFQSVLGVVRGPLNALIDLINGVIRGLNSIKVDIPDWVPMVGGQTFGLSVPTIPRLANGAIVSRSRGGSIVNVGEGRYDEAVVPLGGSQFQALADALGSQIGGGVGGGVRLTGDLKGMQKFIRAEIETADGWRELELSNGATY